MKSEKIPNKKSENERLEIPEYNYEQTPEEILAEADNKFDYVRYVEDWVKPYDAYRILVNTSPNPDTPSYDLIECRPPMSAESALTNRKLCLNVYFDQNRDPAVVAKYTRNGQPMVFNCQSGDCEAIAPLKNVSVKIYFDLEKLLADKLIKEPSSIDEDISFNIGLNMPGVNKDSKVEENKAEERKTPQVEVKSDSSSPKVSSQVQTDNPSPVR